MIDFNCPRCGEHLSVPDSLAGKYEACPACSFVCDVPQEQQPTRERLTRSCSKRTLILLVLSAIAILMFLAVWVPLQVTGSGFPNRSRLTKALAEHGFHLSQTEPTERILRGRQLLAYSYVVDANFPEYSLTVYCTLDDTHNVIALSTLIEQPDRATALEEGQEFRDAKRQGRSDTYPHTHRAARNRHRICAQQALHEITETCFLRGREVANTEARQNAFGIWQRSETHYVKHTKDFEIECIDFLPLPNEEQRITETLIIVKDKDWW